MLGAKGDAAAQLRNSTGIMNRERILVLVVLTVLLEACACHAPSSSASPTVTPPAGSSPPSAHTPQICDDASAGQTYVALCKAVPPGWIGQVPVEFREWAADRLAQRLKIGADNLGESPAAADIENAKKRAPDMAATVANIAATKCTPDHCSGMHASSSAVDHQLQMTMCPGFFPFC